MAPVRKRKPAAATAAPAPSGSNTNGKGGFAKADWKEGFRKKQAGVSDMTLLTTISNESINENLKKRFENADIYTYIGHVLISVNPFRMLPIYDDATLRSYRNKNRLEMAPHVYAIAEAMYYNMLAYKENQCVIISGESGAGKTEAAKKIMEYIAAVAGGDGPSGINQIKEMVLATNPLLESFGCAKTLRNNNSSRHGKYLEIEFDAQGVPIGAIITNYLLEKNRVVGQLRDERNFHIFYQFTKGASAQQREAYGIQDPASYSYTSKSGCLSVDGIDDVADWSDTLQAMTVIGIAATEQDSILRTLATILWLGNVQFSEDQEGNARIQDESVPNFVAYLMEADSGSVIKALTQRVMETSRGVGRRGSVYEVPMNPSQAAAARDALAKSIYDHLFDWIVGRVNVALKSKQKASLVIGVLDIYGFEIFQSNSFEQLCINYVNEKLQQIFIQLTLKTEQEEYVKEQIKWTPIDYFNNKVVCDLIEEKRPPGVFAALNDACATAHADPSAADNSFVQRLSSLSSNQYFESRGDKFLIKHYAGDVTYNIAGMTDKNKDTLSKDLLELVISSPNPFFSQTLFPERPDPDNKKRPPTAGDRIKTSANLLVEKLMRSQPSYIRTIKPNQNKSPSEYDSKAILHQIKYLGLQENIRVRRAGFAYRNTFEKMVERFYLLSPATSYAGDYIWQGDSKTACQQILKDTGIAREEWQMGVTKAFIKNPETLFALEHMRDRYWHNMAARIQRAFRNYLRYKQECASRIQRFWKSKKDGLAFLQLRDYSHQLLGGRKERRRYSLVSMRQFNGDYLDVGGKSPSGELLRSACGIGSGEQVAFSMNGQILVSKLGRSSTRSPRYLVLTSQALYIAITQIANGRPTTTLERKIPLMTIRSVGMSNLRDDWIAVNVASQEEDPVLTCLLKTELVTHLVQQSNGSVSVNISSQVEYTKKKDKKAVIKFVKDESVQRNDVYKSHTVSVASGDPPTSKSMPPAPRKPGVAKPIASGKLLKAGGPANGPTRKPQARTLPGASTTPRPAPMAASAQMPRPAPTMPQAPAGMPRAPAAPVGLAAVIPKAPGLVASVKAAPPPQAQAAPKSQPAKAPPPPPPSRKPVAAAKVQYKCLYDFNSAEEGEVNLVKGEILEVLQKDENGWWKVRKGSEEGWAPSNYLEVVQARLPPPAPPKPAGPKPMLQPNGVNGSNGSNTPASRPGSAMSTSSMNDLAAALKARTGRT